MSGTAATGRPAAEPNLTPMIDVLLVLIIVFMVVAVQVHRTIDVNLPEQCSGVCAANHPIVLEVLPGPAYRINQRSVPPAELLAELRGIYWARPEKIIQVAGYPQARYDEVIEAMDLAKSAGVRVIGIAPKDTYLRR
ncbi:MAG TPA: biopolymer transporter ExbD [Gemmatimonadaceae bacterium]|nr:biopolymer transporter ExbD [Gemmatimonadaceae bacterium]